MGCNCLRMRYSQQPRLVGAGRPLTAKRILDRGAVSDQSNGHFFVQRRGSAWTNMLYCEDLFHSTLHWTTPRLVVILILMYLVGFVAFVPLYLTVVDDCNTDFKTPMSAFFFSVETMMTIGYGASDPFFADCWSMAILISIQSIVGTILDAVCIGLLYDRISRATSRAATIIFSRNAIIKEIDGQLWFQFRVVEMRKHQLVEAHARVYVVRNEKKSPTAPMEYFKTRYARIQDPDDEIGGMLWLVLPMTVVRRPANLAPYPKPELFGKGTLILLYC